jgi:hypothetical protein
MTDNPIHFMRFAIFDATGVCRMSFEHHVRIQSGLIDTSHIEEIIEDVLETMDVDYDILMSPVYDKRSKLWITHRLYGTYEGCVAGFFVR